MNIEIGNSNSVKIETGIVQVYPNLENLKVTPSGKEQIFNHLDSYGYDEVVVEAVTSNTLDIMPSFEKQIYEGLYGTVNVEPMKVPNEKWYLERKDYWDGTIVTDLTEEQYKAMENMKISLTNELILEYDDEVLDLDFSIEDNNLIVNNNVKGLDFYINENGEMEAIY